MKADERNTQNIERDSVLLTQIDKSTKWCFCGKLNL